MRAWFVIATVALPGALRLFGYVSDPRLAKSDIHRIVGEPARVKPSAEPAELKVVTWNIEYGTRFDRVVDTIRRVGADVYLLQEVDRFCRRSHRRQVAKDLADATGMNWVFAGEFQEIGESGDGVPAVTGQAILSRYPITDASVISFGAQAWVRWHLNPLQPRRGNRIALRASTAGIRVYNAHLESGRDDGLRRRQLDDIVAADAIDRTDPHPTVLAGDFNNGPIARTSLLRTVTAASFVDALPGTTGGRTTCLDREYPIDWIFIRHMKSAGGGVLVVDHVSDHYPLTATLRPDR